jgi:hypothetical protein
MDDIPMFPPRNELLWPPPIRPHAPLLDRRPPRGFIHDFEDEDLDEEVHMADPHIQQLLIPPNELPQSRLKKFLTFPYK